MHRLTLPGSLLGLILLVFGMSALVLPVTAAAADLSAVGALPAPPAQPSSSNDELTVEQVRTDRFPRVSMRFTIHPLAGPPPTHLEPAEVAVVNDGVVQGTYTVSTVDRVPTATEGTYEVVWVSDSQATPGQSVSGVLAISVNGKPEIETRFSFIRPLVAQAPAPAAQAEIHALIPVQHPDPGEVNQPLSSAMAAIFAGTAFLVVIAGLVIHANYRAAQDRLAIWVRRSAPARSRAVAKASQSRRQNTPSQFTQFLSQIGSKMLPSAQTQKLRRQLVVAGRPTNQQYIRFVASKAGLAIGLFLLGFWLMFSIAEFSTALLIGLSMGIVGFMLPSIWLGRAIKNRKYELRKALPDTLDLMTIGVSAGLAFDGAIAEIVEKWDNAMSHELATLLGELRMGAGRRQGLLNLADRTQVEEIQTMVSQLIQSDELGISLTDTLLTLAAQMRLRRRQSAEEQAHKAAVKMLIPLVFLIFPALFIVILGPAAQDLFSFFGSTGN